MCAGHVEHAGEWELYTNLMENLTGIDNRESQLQGLRQEEWTDVRIMDYLI